MSHSSKKAGSKENQISYLASIKMEVHEQISSLLFK